MFKNISKLGLLLILILLAFFVVEALNIKEGMSSDMVSDKVEDSDDVKETTDEGFEAINDFSIGSKY
tara:strand:+ start:174 stop:374 length:201 start_codon:yes stop_codon:yes gene_type:complete